MFRDASKLTKFRALSCPLLLLLLAIKVVVLAPVVVGVVLMLFLHDLTGLLSTIQGKTVSLLLITY